MCFQIQESKQMQTSLGCVGLGLQPALPLGGRLAMPRGGDVLDKCSQLVSI